MQPRREHQLSRCAVSKRPASTHDPSEKFDGLAFETYVEQVLVQTLAPGQIVVLDNHCIHKGDKVAELLASKGCSLLFLPPYSPDLNPIEEAFPKIKTFVKACQARA